MARKVFYSFHYDNDCWRTQQVRNIGMIEGNKPLTANDWEEVKKGGDGNRKVDKRSARRSLMRGCACRRGNRESKMDSERNYPRLEHEEGCCWDSHSFSQGQQRFAVHCRPESFRQGNVGRQQAALQCGKPVLVFKYIEHRCLQLDKRKHRGLGGGSYKDSQRQLGHERRLQVRNAASLLR